MIGYLKLNEEILGEINFKVIDESMGVIGGELKPYDPYYKYQEQIQSLSDSKGVANIDDFNFLININENTILYPEGGIGVTDLKEFDEILVEVSGLPDDLKKLVNK